MAISLQRSGLTGRRIMNPLELSTVGLRRPINPPAAEAAPNLTALPNAATPDITGEISGNTLGQINPERTAGLEPVSWDQAKGPLAMVGLGTAAGLTGGLSLAPSLALSAVNTGKAMALGKGLGYLGGKIKEGLGMGDPGTKGVHDAFAAYGTTGLGYNTAGERASGVNYTDTPRTISAEEDKGWFGNNDSEGNDTGDVSDAVGDFDGDSMGHSGNEGIA